MKKTTTKKPAAKPAKKLKPAKEPELGNPQGVQLVSGTTGKKLGKRIAPPTPAKGKKPASARVTKTDMVLELMRRPGGATAAELLGVTEWQAHSLRGFISGVVTKKLGLKPKSEKNAAGERVYSLEA
jgi:hypothetical protein